MSDWRIALDLAATRALASVVPLPPCGRACPWCRNWSRAQGEVLPPPLAAQLQRIGVDPLHPDDLYAFAEPDAGENGWIPHRITFHAVGAILSGPQPWCEDARSGPVRNYVRLRGSPWLTLSVALAQEVGGAPWQAATAGPLLQIDFRLEVPWRLAEPHPPIYISSVPSRRPG